MGAGSRSALLQQDDCGSNDLQPRHPTRTKVGDLEHRGQQRRRLQGLPASTSLSIHVLW